MNLSLFYPSKIPIRKMLTFMRERLHGHHGNQVLDIRTGDVYNHAHRQAVIRKLNPQSLRQIQEKVRQHPDLKEFL